MSSTKSVVAAAVVAALQVAAADPANALTRADIKPVADQVIAGVTPLVEHATNGEAAWYQKRSFWSAIVSGAMVVAGPLLTRYGIDVDPEMREWISASLTTVGGIWAGYLAIRAGTAKRPLGR